MRRTLTVMIFIAALCAVMGVMSATADTWVPSGGLSLTESADSATLGSRIEAFDGERLLGAWCSTTGQFAQLVRSLEYCVYADFSGLKNVLSVELTPDHGKTVWKAKLIPGRGYRVWLPDDLEAGSYAFEWAVRARDRHNRVILVFIPICWSSSRSVSVVNQLMVQEAPNGWETMDAVRKIAHLRGFVSAVAELDPAVIARAQAAAQMSQPVQQASFVPPQASVTKPAREEQPISSELEPSNCTSDVQVKVRPNFPSGATVVLVVDDGEGGTTSRSVRIGGLRKTVRAGMTLVLGTMRARVVEVDFSRKQITAVARGEYTQLKTGDPVRVVEEG